MTKEELSLCNLWGCAIVRTGWIIDKVNDGGEAEKRRHTIFLITQVKPYEKRRRLKKLKCGAAIGRKIWLGDIKLL